MKIENKEHQSPINTKIKLITLWGGGGCGKDTLLNHAIQQLPELHKVISYTTRTKRDYEQEGIDYYFIDKEDFTQKLLKGDIIEASTWDDEFYGTGISALDPDKVNIQILNTEGIEILSDDPRIDIIPIYIAVEEKTRLLRMINREEHPDCAKICRRILQDEEMLNKEQAFDSITYYNGDSIPLENFITFLRDYGLLSKND